jgi:hypothetical protein
MNKIKFRDLSWYIQAGIIGGILFLGWILLLIGLGTLLVLTGA